MKCRHCEKELEHRFLDLGNMPPSNAYLPTLEHYEIHYPLEVYVCRHCWLVQTVDYVGAEEIFNGEYAYFSSISASFVKHAKDYVDMIVDRLKLTEESHVLEIASNDGYLLKNFVEKDIPCLGVEPTESTAREAVKKGIATICEFFGEELTAKLGKYDLIIGNNVYAHVPDINDFTAGLREALKEGGTITLEFPHLMKLIEFTQFDTVYHEHFSYLSLYTVRQIFASHGLRVFDAEELSTHGGSLRVYGCHMDDKRGLSPEVYRIIREEGVQGLQHLETYKGFQAKADKIARDFSTFIFEQKKLGKKIAAVGAAAKGNTLLNYAGISSAQIDFVCDSTPAKQGKYLPGSRIPIVSMQRLWVEQPDWVVVLPWNVAGEIINQAKAHGWKKYGVAVAVPELKLYGKY